MVKKINKKSQSSLLSRQVVRLGGKVKTVGVSSRGYGGIVHAFSSSKYVVTVRNKKVKLTRLFLSKIF